MGRGIWLFDDEERDRVAGKLLGMGPLAKCGVQLKGTWVVLGRGLGIACDVGGFGSWVPSPGFLGLSTGCGEEEDGSRAERLLGRVKFVG